MTDHSIEAIAAYPQQDVWDRECFKLRTAFDAGRASVQAPQLAATRETLLDIICDDPYGDDSTCGICEPTVDRIFASGVLVDADTIRGEAVKGELRDFRKRVEQAFEWPNAELAMQVLARIEFEMIAERFPIADSIRNGKAGA